MYTLLTPAKTEKPTKKKVRIYDNLTSPEAVTNTLKNLTGLLAVDLETTGTQAANYSVKVVGIGVSNGKTSVYYDRAGLSPEAWSRLLTELACEERQLVAHNVFFDSAFLLRDGILEGIKNGFSWAFCTYGLYRQLANEGWKGQAWSLKTAQVELLGWESTNESELDTWLVGKGYYKTVSKEPKEGYYKIDTDNGVRYAKPDKAEMHRAPSDILGY